MKVARVIAGVVGTAFVFGPGAFWVGGARPEAFENRPLAPTPSAASGWAALDQVGPWASDRLPGRARAVHANSWIDYFVLGELPTSGAGPTTASPAAAGAAGSRPITPTVVRGKDGYLFLGRDFDSACDDGRQFRVSLRRLARLAHVIRSSGRRVVFTVGPNKSSVAAEELPRTLPRGECARRGMRNQQAALNGLDDPLFVNMVRPLASAQQAGRQVYWKTDTHWNTSGGALLTKSLARALRPGVEKRLEVAPTTLTKTGDLMKLAGLTFEETTPAATLSSGGTVSDTSARAPYDPLTEIYTPIRWRTRPSSEVIRGRTLIVGDSFSYYTLSTLRPLFANGSFMWTGHNSREQMAAAIAKSDTVVLEVVQRYVHGTDLTRPAFRRQVARKLSRSQR